MSDEVRILKYDDGLRYIVNFDTGEVFSEYLEDFEDLLDDYLPVSYKNKKYISLTQIAAIKLDTYKKKDILMRAVIKDAKRIIKKVLLDACDS